MTSLGAFRLLRHGPALGAWNMAVDELLLDETGEKTLQPRGVLRFYRWNEPTVSLGYFQNYADWRLHSAGKACAVVRRLTGGGAIVHDAELTYSIVLPAPHRLAARRDELYAAVHESLIAALARLGIHADLSAARAARSGEPFLCFQRRAAGDVVLDGMKIAGSAQRRRNGAVLQHGSVLLRRSPAAEMLPGIVDLSGRSINEDQLAQLWLPELGRRLVILWQEDELTEQELHAADTLVHRRYAWAPWTEERVKRAAPEEMGSQG